jgi:hypothetical protein
MTTSAGGGSGAGSGARSGTGVGITRGGEVSDEEVAAIVAAVEVVWPRPVAIPPSDAPRWRFSGRWWTKPVPLRRSRPW